MCKCSRSLCVFLEEAQRKRLHRHSPFEEPPEWLQIADNTTFWDQTYGSMLKAVDSGIGNVTQELVKQGMWDSTFIILTGDNGGQCMDPRHPAEVPYGPGNSWPLYGRKCTPWEGGTRSAALVSGGLIPAALRGTQSTVLMHVADWYLLRQTSLLILSPFRLTDLFCGAGTTPARLASAARPSPTPLFAGRTWTSATRTGRRTGTARGPWTPLGSETSPRRTTSSCMGGGRNTPSSSPTSHG